MKKLQEIYKKSPWLSPRQLTQNHG